jgi:ribosome-associated toxin RatA of RatAB toxin-antitoxin module
MKRVERSALLPLTPEQVFDVVNDVAAYSEFLPWCDESEVIESSATAMKARLSIVKGGMRQSFTTQNQLVRPNRIDLRLLAGPFSSLEGQWRFTPLGDEGCKVELKLAFDFDSRLANFALGKVFEQAADTMVDAFSRRVRDVCTDD